MATHPHHSTVSKRRTLLVSLAALLGFTAGCSPPKDPGPDVVAPIGGSLPATAVRQVEFEPPMPLRGGRYWLVPVAVQVDREAAERIGKLAERSRQPAGDMMESAAYSVYRPSRVWSNLVVFDAQTGQSRLLLRERALITRLKYPQPLTSVTIPPEVMQHIPAEQLMEMLPRLEAPQWPDDLMLVGVIEQDTNQDGVLGADDAVVAYSTRVGDWQLTRLTPEGHSWQNDIEDLPNQRLTLTTIVDRDADGDFELWGPGGKGSRVQDEHRYFLVDLSNAVSAAPMVSEQVRDQTLELLGITPATRPATQPAQ